MIPAALHSRPLYVLALLILCLTFPTKANAAWLRKAGETLFIQNASLYTSNHFIDNAGNCFSQPRFAKRELNLYLEHGWTDQWTVGVNAFAHELLAEQPASLGGGTAHNIGIADVELFARTPLWQGESAVLSVQPLIKLPSWYQYDGNPRSGTDTMDAELRLQGGVGFDLWGHHHFATLDLAYRKRTGDWHDQWKMDATLGIAVHQRWTILPQLFITQRAEGTTPNVMTSAAVSDYDLIKGQLSAVYQVNPRTRLQLGVFSHLRARNTGDGEGMLASVWLTF